MVIVLIAGYTKLMIPAILNMDIDCYIIKQEGTKVFFYFDSPLTTKEIFQKVTNTIIVQCGPQYVFQLYTLYNGMIDLTPYLPEHIKKQTPYYLKAKKDVSTQELEQFLKRIQK